jgi:hypothetical protein
MSRLTAWVILIAAAGLVYSLGFTTFDQLTERYESIDSGGLRQVRVECPAPWQVVFDDAEPESDRDAETCRRKSIALLIEAGLVALVAGFLTVKPITRPRPEHIDPLSEKLDA